MAEPIVEHGIPRNGETAERPTAKAFPGALFFDKTIGYLLVWNSVFEQWDSASVQYGTTATQPTADDVPIGSLFYNDTIGALQVSDGSSWLEIAVTDNQSSSSTSSSSSLSSSSTSSSSASSESSSSTSSST